MIKNPTKSQQDPPSYTKPKAQPAEPAAAAAVAVPVAPSPAVVPQQPSQPSAIEKAMLATLASIELPPPTQVTPAQPDSKEASSEDRCVIQVPVANRYEVHFEIKTYLQGWTCYVLSLMA